MLTKQFNTSAYHMQVVRLSVEIKVYAETQITAAVIAIKNERFFDYLTALGQFERFQKMAYSPVFDGLKYAEDIRNMVFPEYPDYEPENDVDVPF